MNLIYIVGIAIILFFVALTIYGYIITNGETPYNTNNDPASTDKQYCGYKQYTNCQSIPQNQPIPISMIQGVSN